MTTENPYFFLSKALISRSSVFEFRPLERIALLAIFDRVCRWFGSEHSVRVTASEPVREALVGLASGDARRLINLVELAVPSDGRKEYDITIERLEEVARKKSVVYDRDADEHYDTISAFIKSVRGSDPDAALYWAAKMLEGGEPPEFLCRRLIILASEDIGNADPAALPLVIAAFEACRVVGMPEARIPLGQAVTYCATAPKSNAAYLAMDAALEDIRGGRVLQVPNHLKDGNFYNREKLGRAQGYVYPHDHPWHYVRQAYLPEDRTYYKPSEMGFEKTIKKRMEFLEQLDRNSKEGPT
jgi:putative ATPase